MKRAPRYIITQLENALRSAKMGDAASFGFPNDTVAVNAHFEFETNGKPQPLDAYIKERTRLYRETWIIPQIEAALAWAKGSP